MIMPIKATESGKITHNLSPGSVISAGDLLASLELKDPSKVKKIGTFDGTLDIADYCKFLISLLTYLELLIS